MDEKTHFDKILNTIQKTSWHNKILWIYYTIQLLSNLNLEQKAWLKSMMMHVKHITQIIKSNLKLKCQGEVYVIKVMHTH